MSNRLQKLIKFKQDPNLVILEELEQVKDGIISAAEETKKVAEETRKVAEEIQKTSRDKFPATFQMEMPGVDIVTIKGDKPVAGVDYPIPENGYTPVKGVDYFDGEPGKPGKDYVLTEKDKKEIAKKVEVPVVEKIIEKTEVIREQPIVKEVAVTEKAEEIAEKLKDTKLIKELKVEIFNLNQKIIRQNNSSNGTMHRGGGLSVDEVNALIAAYAGHGSIILATDSGDHTIYNLASPITSNNYYAIINNGMYTPDDPGFPFSATGSVLTFSSPLPADLAGTLIKLVCI